MTTDATSPTSAASAGSTDDRRALLQSALQAIDELQAQLDAARAEQHVPNREPIAIVGLSCRFPGGANTPEAYWDLLCDGRDVVTEFPAARRELAEQGGVDLAALTSDTAWYGGYLDQIDTFDPQFFGIAPREAATMDPQQRLVLEVSWEALERAGIAPDSLVGSATGVFVGITGNEYIQLAKLSGPDTLDVYSATGGALNAAAGRVAYTLGLQGPCMAIDTACSSSLVAVHQACQSLLSGESDMALAGGVNLLLLPDAFVCFNRWGMMAADGRCKTFDTEADGFVRGEGCGIVVLKRLSDAVAAGDPVLAVINGSAVNQDGRSSGLTVPNGLAQQAVLQRALEAAAVDPADIQYFEAHGTGTTLGDPIEVEAIGAVLGRGRPIDRRLVLGSVKTNIGHLESAAGIAGLIKVVLSMQHAAIPPNLHFHERNPQIPWPEFRIDVPTSVTPWPAVAGRRLAGVSGFGFSGTNAHVVLESPPDPEMSTAEVDPRPRVLALSARSSVALGHLADLYAGWIDSRPDIDLAAVHTSVNAGRARLPERAAVIATGPDQLVERLRRLADDTVTGDGIVVGRGTRPRIAWLFTGQGSQHVGMARRLYDVDPVFREALDECVGLADPALPRPLLDVLFAEPGSSEAALLDQTGFTQPALFAVEWALAQVWRSRGVRPEAMLGHSVGEIAAAAVAEVFSLDDAVRLVTARGALMQALPAGGAMHAVFAPHGDVEGAIAEHPELSLAAVNGPAHCVISGNGAAVAALSQQFVEQGVRVQPLTVSHAFHSPLMRPMLEQFRAVAESVTFRAPRGVIVSNVTGQVIGSEIATADYWVDHVVAPVRFADSIGTMREQLGIDTFVEIGPHPVLTAMAQACVTTPEALTWAPSLRRGRDDLEQIQSASAELFVAGAALDWAVVNGAGRRQAMPTYPFQRQRCWLDPAPRRRRHTGDAHPLLGVGRRMPTLGATVYESAVAADLPAWMGDHRLSGTPVLPGTGFVEIVLAASDPEHDIIESLAIVEPLMLEESGEEVAVQTVVTESGGARDVQVLSVRGDTGAGYGVHARATVRRADAPFHADPIDIEAIGSVYSESLDVDEYYEYLRSIGLTYGPAFRGLVSLARRPGAALGLVRLPVADAPQYLLHPALFDACFHVLGAAIAPLEPDDSDDMFVPVMLQGLRLSQRGATAAWCVVEVLEGGTSSGRRPSYSARVALYDIAGVPIATVDRLDVRRTPRAMWERRLPNRDFVYDLAWRGQSRSDEAAAPRDWVVIDDHHHTGELLASALRASGARCVIVDSGSGVGAVTDALDGLAAASDAPPAGVVDLRPIDDGAGLLGDPRPVAGALELVQTLAGRVPGRVRLWFVTRHGQSVEGEAADPGSAAVWGLARVVSTELGHLGCTCIDIDIDTDVDELANELILADTEDQVALRGRQRSVARLARGGDARHGLPDAPYRLVLSQRGSLDAVGFAASERRPPGAGEVEIEVRATGLNFRDVLNVLGMYPGDPGMPGLECAGVVTAVGDDVASLVPGDAVVGIAPNAYDSHVVTRSDLVVRLPDGLGFADAASLPIAYLTAAYGLHHLARLQPGDRLLVHAAAGGVGMAAVQIARRLGAEVFATVGSAAKRKALEALGVVNLYSSRTTDFAQQILAATAGEGVDVVLNSLSGEFIDSSFEALAAGGRFLEIGKRGIWTAEQVEARRPDAAYHVYDLADLLGDNSTLHSLLQGVVDDVAGGDIEPLPVRAFPADKIESGFRFMAQARHIGKVVIVHPAAHPLIRDDGGYIVTGGLGALGLELASWLVDQGAAEVTLIGRSAPTQEAEGVISGLRARGASVRTVVADVADQQGVDRALAAASEAGIALRGLFHLAGVTDDGAIGQQTWDRVRAVLAPKLGAAELLDRATRHLDLDHFVLFSSASGLLGAAGQSGYAAANRGLDAIAYRRRAAGLAALSIDWGAWGGAGMAARLDSVQQKRMADRGVIALDPPVALAAMASALQSSAVHVAVLAADWHAMLARSDDVPPLLREVLGAGAPVDAIGSGLPLVDELVAIDDVAERLTRLRAAVVEQVVAVLGLDPHAAIDGRQGLTDLGMDSLMAVELSNRMSALLDRALPSTLPYEYPTLDDLATFVIDLLADTVDLDLHSASPSRPSRPDLPDAPLLEAPAGNIEDALLRELDDAGY